MIKANSWGKCFLFVWFFGFGGAIVHRSLHWNNKLFFGQIEKLQPSGFPEMQLYGKCTSAGILGVRGMPFLPSPILSPRASVVFALFVCRWEGKEGTSGPQTLNRTFYPLDGAKTTTLGREASGKVFLPSCNLISGKNKSMPKRKKDLFVPGDWERLKLLKLLHKIKADLLSWPISEPVETIPPDKS